MILALCLFTSVSAISILLTQSNEANIDFAHHCLRNTGAWMVSVIVLMQVKDTVPSFQSSVHFNYS